METVTNGASPKKSKKKNTEQGVKRKGSPHVSPNVTPKKKNKKDNGSQSDTSMNLSSNKDDHIVLSSDGEIHENPQPKKATKKKKQVLDETVMPAESISKFKELDLAILIKNISEHIPPNDTLMFKFRARKIDWEKVAFKGYSPKLCRDVWYMIQGQLRQNRTLTELLNDAKEWTSTEWKENLKPKIHPHFPKRPLTTAYLLYFSEAKNHILSIKPNLDHVTINKLAKKVFATIEPEKIEYYEKVAAENKKKYEEAVEAFYEYYPGLRKKQMEEKVRVQNKPCTPFALFAQEQMMRLCENLDKAVVKEALKEEWKTMGNREKLPYIDMALELQKKCIEEAEPDEKPKLVLSKEELRIKEEMMGKPQKPPSSAYALFSKTMFRNNEELKETPPNEKMKKVGSMWKELADEEKTKYKEKVNLLITKYKKEYEEYNKSIENDSTIEYFQKLITKTKSHKTKTVAAVEEEPEEPTLPPINITLDQDSADMLSVIIPESWEEMSLVQRTTFIHIIKEVKNCFDNKIYKININKTADGKEINSDEDHPAENNDSDEDHPTENIDSDEDHPAENNDSDEDHPTENNDSDEDNPTKNNDSDEENLTKNNDSDEDKNSDNDDDDIEDIIEFESD